MGDNEQLRIFGGNDDALENYFAVLITAVR